MARRCSWFFFCNPECAGSAHEGSLASFKLPNSSKIHFVRPKIPCGYRVPSPSQRTLKGRDFRKNFNKSIPRFRHNLIADLEAREASCQLVKPYVDHGRGVEREQLAQQQPA